MWDEEELGKCFEATMLAVAMRQTATMKALQAIAKNLNETERQEVQDLRFHHEETNRRGRRGHRGIRVWESFCVSPKVAAWGVAQALALRPGIRPEKLCGDKYLQLEIPYCGFPSVLDSSVPDKID